MTLVCPNQNWFDARAARLTLVREEAEGGVELFAYLTLDTADDDMDVETGRLFCSIWPSPRKGCGEHQRR